MIQYDFVKGDFYDFPELLGVREAGCTSAADIGRNVMPDFRKRVILIGVGGMGVATLNQIGRAHV